MKISSKFFGLLALALASPSTHAEDAQTMYPDDFDNLIVQNFFEFQALNEKERVAYCIHRLEAEVNNGGFHQFFSNSTGQFAPETLEALAAIGAVKTRTLLERAISIAYPSGCPEDRTEHQAKLEEEVEEKLYELDLKFYLYEDDLGSLVNQYLADAA